MYTWKPNLSQVRLVPPSLLPDSRCKSRPPLIQCERLECILNTVRQTRIVESIFLLSLHIKTPSAQPAHTRHAQRTNRIPDPDRFDKYVDGGQTSSSELVYVSGIGGAGLVREGDVGAAGAVLAVVAVREVFVYDGERVKAAFGQHAYATDQATDGAGRESAS